MNTLNPNQIRAGDYVTLVGYKGGPSVSFGGKVYRVNAVDNGRFLHVFEVVPNKSQDKCIFDAGEYNFVKTSNEVLVFHKIVSPVRWIVPIRMGDNSIFNVLVNACNKTEAKQIATDTLSPEQRNKCQIISDAIYFLTTGR